MKKIIQFIIKENIDRHLVIGMLCATPFLYLLRLSDSFAETPLLFQGFVVCLPAFFIGFSIEQVQAKYFGGTFSELDLWVTTGGGMLSILLFLN
jgi:hypothetical protein